MMTEELKKIEEFLGRLDLRLSSLETRVETAPALSPYPRTSMGGGAGEGSADGGGRADGDLSGGTAGTKLEGITASEDSDYWAAAVQVGLALSQGGGLKGWQTAVAALLPAVAESVDRSIADKPVLKAALVPAALGGAAYYIGRVAIR
jgi:hypothetical protein